MLRIALLGLALAIIGSVNAACAEASAEPLDFAIACSPSPEQLVYHCNLQVTDARTGFPICIHGAAIEFVMPAISTGYRGPRIDVHTNAEGDMKDVLIKLQLLGEWRVLFRTDASVVEKHLKFLPEGVTSW